MDQDSTIIAGQQPTSDRTQVIDPAGMDRTQMGASVECPVCLARNLPIDTFCSECGFLLSSTPTAAVNAPDEPTLVLTDTKSKQQFKLWPGTYTVGRENADVLLNDPSVSRQHASIEVSTNGARVTDNGSTNGTSVGMTKLSPEQTADVIDEADLRFGSAILSVKLTPQKDHTEEDAQVEEDAVDDVSEAEVVIDEAPEDEVAETEQPVLSDGAFLTEKQNPSAKYMIGIDGVNIGRRTGNDIVLSNPYVSSSHAIIAVDDGIYRLTDIGSTNGTTINGEKLLPNQPIELKDGDEIIFGQMEVTFSISKAEENG